jgi:hypothetical protein
LLGHDTFGGLLGNNVLDKSGAVDWLLVRWRRVDLLKHDTFGGLLGRI